MRPHYAFLWVCHGVAAWTLATRFSWSGVALAAGLQVLFGCLGITLGYHRLLTHRALEVPRWLERTLAVLGTLAVQGDPVEWVAVHRQHHRYADTPRDPHDAGRGFFFSHMGWIDRDYFPHVTEEKLRTYAGDLWRVPFYRGLHRAGALLVVAFVATLYALGGWDAVLWGFFVRLVVGDHCTWLVNSAGHCLGWRAYARGDRSTNCTWAALLSFGEAFHNNHHAFPSSARHGLAWWQPDMTWGVICLLRRAGLARKVKLPRPWELAAASGPRSLAEWVGVTSPLPPPERAAEGGGA